MKKELTTFLFFVVQNRQPMPKLRDNIVSVSTDIAGSPKIGIEALFSGNVHETPELTSEYCYRLMSENESRGLLVTRDPSITIQPQQPKL
jgi:hypothetical protein